MQELALHLAAQYGKDARVTQLLDRVRVVVVPLINADGFIASRSAVDPADALGDPDIAPELFGPGLAPSLAEGALIPAGGILAYRRKNCRGVDPGGTLPCELTTGVDPNRNYGFKWGGPGASTSPNSQTYRSEGPWSEPETQAVHEFSQVRDVTSLMTVYTIAALVLRPPGLGVDGVAPDEAALKALGDGIASDTGYKSQFGYELYDTSGTTEDWNYGAAGTYGYTIELGPGDAGFHGDYQSNVIDQWNGTGEQAGKGMRAAFLRLAEAAGSGRDFSTIAGRAPAGRTLRIKKTFKTATSPICTIASPLDIRNDAYACVAPTPPQHVDDKLEYTTKRLERDLQLAGDAVHAAVHAGQGHHGVLDADLRGRRGAGPRDAPGHRRPQRDPDAGAALRREPPWAGADRDEVHDRRAGRRGRGSQGRARRGRRRVVEP